MKITRDMKIKEVLAFDEEKMLESLMWLAPEFKRLRALFVSKIII